MILYTFQPAEAIKAAKKMGYLTCYEEYARDAWNVCDNDDFWETQFKRPYEFMRKQMRKRLKNYSGEYPIWAYVDKPDLRCYRRDYKQNTLYLVLDIPDERVLLSCFDGWHWVLNNSYFGLT